LNSFISAQNRYSVLNRDIEEGVVPAAEEHGIGILPYFPLESGILTGKYQRGQVPPSDSRMAFGIWETRSQAFLNNCHFDLVDQLKPLCDQYSHSLLDLAMGWLVSKPFISSIIAGVTTPEQLEQNSAAAEWCLPPEEVEAIDAITKPD
jgi:aryl-alcohol dehydrogenase-like predicted oxidoreductase